MPKIVTIDEMLEIMHQGRDPRADEFRIEVELLADKLAERLVLRYPTLVAGEATFEGLAFAGTCVPFTSDDPPAIFEQLGIDEGGEWEPLNLGAADI